MRFQTKTRHPVHSHHNKDQPFGFTLCTPKESTWISNPLRVCWSLRRHCSTLKHATTIGKPQGNNKQQQNKTMRVDDDDILKQVGISLYKGGGDTKPLNDINFVDESNENVMRCCRCCSPTFSSSSFATPFRQIFSPCRLSLLNVGCLWRWRYI